MLYTPNFTNYDPMTVPFFAKQNSSDETDDLLLNNLNFLAAINSRSVLRSTPEYLFMLPDATFALSKYNATNFDYTVQVNDNLNFQRYTFATSESSITMNRARAVANMNAAYVNNRTRRRAAATFGPLPYTVPGFSIDVILLVTAALMPAALSFLMPIFAFTLVLEKEKKLREMMKIMGMNGNIYWLVNYLFDFLLYVIVCLAFVVVQLMFRARLFMQTSPLLLFLMLFLWGQALIAAGFLISTVFRRASAASLFGYLLNILSMIGALVLCLSVYDVNTSPAGWFWAYPYFCFYRVIFVMVVNCSQLKCVQGFDYSTGTWYGGDIGLAFFALSMEIIFMAILAWYFNRVIPQEFGIADHPLFFLKPIKQFFVWIFRKVQGRCMKTQPINVNLDSPKEITTPESPQQEKLRHPSVYSHEGAIAKGLFDGEPLIINKLTKRYPTGKVALKGLTFAVRKGECYGLLGPNGAGKSTMMSILYGLFPPTGGDALVAGYDLKHIPEIQRNIGVSMQFDVLWESMTVSEHLMFYARLKGVREVTAHVKELIAAVSLEKKANAYAGSLSGGMKRRLSLAIAMIGSPLVVFLDEPTTGLDPQSKRHVWKCISSFQKNRAMVLTTHDMDEAAALCARYGMLCDGQLRFDGTQQELRNNFSHQYKFRLDVTFDVSRQQDVIDYVKEASGKECEPIQDEGRQQPGRMSFGLAQDVQISEVWSAMQSIEAKERGGIKEWSLGQMSMETLFIKLVQSEAEVDKKNFVPKLTKWDKIKNAFKSKKQSLGNTKNPVADVPVVNNVELLDVSDNV
ncbi:hypothetical protein AKO1_007010 [Acrasis kona]|uniref:ABC transporter domain-containing protein n=1 Tax=Acrasis kona TaxID=1008807 RepID=A0AAW2YVQ1_9EUKA